MERGQIVALATVVIPPENTPQKKTTDYLIATPRWKYVGPVDTINFEWQIGRWGIGFAGDTARKYSTFSQPASATLKEFTTSLPAISLSPLTPRDEPYDCEIWFKDGFSDLRVIVENCVKIPPPPLADVAGFVITSHTFTVGRGGNCYVTVSFSYRGPAVSPTLYAAIGKVWPIIGFDEYLYSSAVVSIPESLSWTYYTRYVIIPIPTGAQTGIYDLYAKMYGPGFPDVFTNVHTNSVTIV